MDRLEREFSKWYQKTIENEISVESLSIWLGVNVQNLEQIARELEEWVPASHQSVFGDDLEFARYVSVAFAEELKTVRMAVNLIDRYYDEFQKKTERLARDKMDLLMALFAGFGLAQVVTDVAMLSLEGSTPEIRFLVMGISIGFALLVVYVIYLMMIHRPFSPNKSKREPPE